MVPCSDVWYASCDTWYTSKYAQQDTNLLVVRRLAVRKMIVVVDLGSYKFRAAAFQNGRLLATDEILSGCWHPNNTEDILYARERVAVLVERLEGITTKQASEIILVLSGPHVATVTMHVTTAVSGKTVTNSDKMALISLAMKALNNGGKAALSVVVDSYQISDGTEVTDPVGLRTSVVKARCIVSRQSKAIYKKWLSVFQQRYPSKGIQLTSAEKFVGCYSDTCACVFDLGNTSKAYLVEYGKCTRSINLACSCEDITKGITDSLVPMPVREKVKSLYCASGEGDDIFVQLDDRQVVFSRKDISSIVHANATKVVTQLIGELQSIGVCDKVEQFVVIGGAATMLTETALDGILREQLDYPGCRFKQVVVPRYKLEGEGYGPEWSIVFAAGFNSTDCPAAPGLLTRIFRWFKGCVSRVFGSKRG